MPGAVLPAIIAHAQREATGLNQILLGVLGYGARIPDLEALLSLVHAPESAGMLVFWNSPDAAVEERLAALSAASPQVEIRTSQDNLGSAGGYRRLLEWASSRDSWNYLLLLDDDQVLQTSALAALSDYASARASRHDVDTLYLAYRRDLTELSALVEQGTPLADIRPGACLGFHLANLFRPPAGFSSHVDGEGIRLDAAPYGGLLIPRAALHRLGFPIESLFLYADDAELTLRFTRGGGTIRLLPQAVVTDRFPSWNATDSRGGNLMRRILHLDDTKARYEARNRNFLSRRFYPGSRWTYAANKAVFLAAVYVVAAANGRLARARLIHTAIVEGEAMAANESLVWASE